MDSPSHLNFGDFCLCDKNIDNFLLSASELVKSTVSHQVQIIEV